MNFRLITSFVIVFISSYTARSLPPQQALAQMKTADGFTVDLVASEPEIRQPLSVTFDDRGRMWAIQYLQYPTPAGLKPVKVDQYLRTTYDKVPEPPPRGPKGADKITICEDTNGDGRMDKFTDFVTGLNLCSGLALGYDGAFVVQPPYLLFYPDKNHDDIPDSDPEILLSGFGMEDAHAFANSLTWGPDGWLYGAQGSTVTANVRGIEFQQGIWRYHPRTKRFEVFAEGGGNTWGVDFDSEGELFAGTNFYEKMLHHMQGAYYVKNFSKHGALHNPHTYGYFDHVPYSGYKGLHISIGGIVYHGGAFPSKFEGTYIYANTLDHAIYFATFQPNGSTVTATHGGTLLKTDDELFRPIDCTIGPDGFVYVSDWTDKRATHVDPLDTWDRSNGRIYRIRPSKALIAGRKNDLNLRQLSSKQLVGLLGSTNSWYSRWAVQVLAERRDKSVIPALRRRILESKDHRLELESLWALYGSGGFDDTTASKLLLHTNESVRKWTIRFLGDDQKISPKLRSALVTLARKESSPLVRAQLACSAKRFDGADALPIIAELLLRSDDLKDTQIPLLLWWALENKSISHRAQVLEIFVSPGIWNSPLVEKFIAERLARRYASEGTDECFAACARLLEISSTHGKSAAVVKGMEQALQGRVLATTPPSLQTWLAKAWPEKKSETAFLKLALRLGFPDAYTTALKTISSSDVPTNQRVELIEILGQTGKAEVAEQLLTLLKGSGAIEIRTAALNGLQRFPDKQIAQHIVSLYATFPVELRSGARNVLVTRPAWAELVVSAVEAGTIQRGDISREQARQIASSNDGELNRRVQKIWGKVQSESPAEKQSRVNELKLVLKPSGVAGREVKGDLASGGKIFQQHCAVCHKLRGEGAAIGPDLTGVDRKNTEFLLSSIVDPSGYIRAEYISYDLETKDDRTISGLMVDANASTVTVLDRANQKQTFARDQIKELRESQSSLMPEGLLDTLTPQQIIDLFAYLQRD